MQSLTWHLLLLTIFTLAINGIGYSQSRSSHTSGRRSIDSIEMLMSGPRNFLQSPVNLKTSPAFQKKPVAEVFRDITAGKITRSSAIACSDTSGRYLLDKDPFYYLVESTTGSADGNIFVIGHYTNTLDNSIVGGFLMKCNDKGVAQWTHLYNTTIQGEPFTYCYYYKLLELTDGTLLLAGKSLNPTNGHYDLMLTHTDKSGSVLWNKTYSSKLWIMTGSGSPDFFYIVDIKQDQSTGDIFFTGPHWEEGLNVTRMKITDGTIVWSDYYGGISYDFNVPFGIDLRANDLFVFSRYVTGIIQRARVDKATGNALANNYLEIADPSKIYLGFVNSLRLIKMDNGHYLLSGNLNRYYISNYDPDQTSPLAHAGIVEVDADFNFVKAWYFSNSTEAYYPNYVTRVTVRKDGTGVFSMLGNLTAAGVYVQFHDQQILNQRTLSYQNEGIFIDNAAIATGDGGDLIIKDLTDLTTLKGKIEFLSLHVPDTSSDCLGVKDYSNYIFPYQLKPSYRYTDAGTPNDFTESITRAVTVSNIDWNYTAACTQTHFCDTLSLVKNADTICINAPFSFTVRTNPACRSNITLDYNPSQIQSYTRVNDSLFSFNFKTTGTVSIHGFISGCAMLKDSVKVVVVAAAVPGTINLGPDTAICPGNTIVLHTKAGLASYTWQDGSTDSIFTVKQPGLYYVRVVDGCGNVLNDTITVAARVPAPFDLGPDSSLCEKDSIQLKAPAAFANYSWLPNYRISSLTTQNVFVSPLVNTVYHVKAEATGGCIVEDSVRIFVKHGVLINLGADKSFCNGDSLVLDAGAGFNSYTWNNGTIAQFNTVYTAGYYSVVATNQEGCKSADTMRVVNVFVNPQPNLGTDSIICAGTRRIINAGVFAQYNWNTGSTASTISVTTTGLYSVAVTDKNNCKGSDSLFITRMVNPPGHFLPADTFICTYGKLDLQANTLFNNYTWNTGASSAFINVASAGTYWLEIKDSNNCIGRDSIVVSSRDCMTGFYIPNAFTPGHDGKNDTFKPIIFGNTLQYEFTVYNRFGQIVFSTRQPGKGWDGTAAQSTNAFVWTCRYQLENNPVRFEKGTVLLLK